MRQRLEIDRATCVVDVGQNNRKNK